jgi:hypothetical protein
MKRRTALCLAGFWAAALGAAGLTIDTVTGDAQARGVKGEFAPAKVGDTLAVGSALRTGRDGRAGVKADTQNGFILQPDSMVRVEAPAGGRADGGLRLALEGGRIESALPSWAAGQSYEVATGAGSFVARGTAFAVTYALGPKGEFVGGAEVSAGEVEYVTPECTVPSVPANGGLSVVRTVGLDSVLLELKAVGNGVTVVIGGKHRVTVPAGATVRIAMAFRFLDRFAAVLVQEGTAVVGGRTVTPGDGGVFIAGSQVLPNAGAGTFMEAVAMEAGAYAEAQLPGLSPEQLAALDATRQSAARAMVDSAVGAGVMPMYPPPFVPERPLSTPLSPSGTP